MLVVACSSAAPAPAEPTPNIDATVEARAKEIVASQATSIPSPTNTQAPSPTNTAVHQPTKTPKPVPTATPTVVPAATSVPTATPRPLPTATPTSVPTPTPAPPTKFEGGFVMQIGGSFQIEGEIAFKIGPYVAEQTVTLGGVGHMQLTDLYATSIDSNLPYTAQTGSGGGGNPPNVIAGRVFIDGNYAPDGTIVTAWIGGEEIVEARTTVVNNPVALVPTELVSKLETYISPPSPLPTPCPQYLDCGQQYYSGRLSDDIEVIWDVQNWKFYSPDPAWRLANNYSEAISGSCWINAKTYINFDKQANGLEGVSLFEGWNSGGCLE